MYKSISVPSLTGNITDISIGHKDFYFIEDSLRTKQKYFEISLFENNLFYFYVDKFKFNTIDFILNKTVSIYLHEEKIKIVGEFQKMLKPDKEFFLSKKREEIPDSLGLGEFLVFIPEQYFGYYPTF